MQTMQFAARVVAPAVLTLMAASAQASGPVLYAGLDAGGDTVAELSSGPDQNAGDGLSVMLGYELDLMADAGLAARVAVGYSFDTVDATNGDSDLTRFPIEAVLIKSFGPHRIGAGILMHRNPKLEQSISGLGSAEVEFDDASGATLLYEYDSQSAWFIGVRLVSMEYELEGFEPLDANSVGVYFGGRFGN